MYELAIMKKVHNVEYDKPFATTRHHDNMLIATCAKEIFHKSTWNPNLLTGGHFS